jgi:hypothetical protein
MPKFPFVHVKLVDLLDDPRNYSLLLKRCSVAARNAQFVLWGQIIEFNLQAIEANDFYAAVLLAIRLVELRLIRRNWQKRQPRWPVAVPTAGRS